MLRELGTFIATMHDTVSCRTFFLLKPPPTTADTVLSNPFRGVPLRGVGVVVVGLGEELEVVAACVAAGCWVPLPEAAFIACCVSFGPADWELETGGVEDGAACVVWDVDCTEPDLAAGTPWFIGGSLAKDCIGMVSDRVPNAGFE